jgi:hypothetical protein
MLFMDEETGKIGWGSIACAYFVPLTLVVVFGYMLNGTFCNPEDIGA